MRIIGFQILGAFFTIAGPLSAADFNFDNAELAKLPTLQINDLYAAASARGDYKACGHLMPYIIKANKFPITANFSGETMEIGPQNNLPVLQKKPTVNFQPYREIKTIKEIDVNEIMASEGTTIVFWDLDLTLVRQRFLISGVYPQDRDKIINRVLNGALNDENHPDHSKAQKFKNYLETDPRFFEMVRIEYANQLLMQELHKRGAIVVGLTARPKKAAHFSDHSLKNLGIDFAELSNLKDWSLNLTNEAVLQNGIFYTGHSDDKAIFVPILVSRICAKLGRKGPFTVFHFDDNEEEILAFSECDVESYPAVDDFLITPIYYRAHDVMLDLLSEHQYMIIDEVKNLFKEFCDL